MSEVLQVLVIDDHPVIIEVYKNVLLEIEKNFLESKLRFQVTEANNCDEALKKIHQASRNNPYHLIFLDIKLPSSQFEKIYSGEDLGELIIKLLPESKLIVFTGHTEIIRLSSILNNLNPDGFLLKSEVSTNEIKMAIQEVLDDNPYYSKTILKLVRKQLSSNIRIDKIDRLLLQELSVGTKMKDLPTILPLSMAGIERRKRGLKNLFNIPSEEDKVLIELAKENGFI